MQRAFCQRERAAWGLRHWAGWLGLKSKPVLIALRRPSTQKKIAGSLFCLLAPPPDPPPLPPPPLPCTVWARGTDRRQARVR